MATSRTPEARSRASRRFSVITSGVVSVGGSSAAVRPQPMVPMYAAVEPSRSRHCAKR